MKEKTILILGSNGYLGLSLSAELLEDGHTIIGVDNNLKTQLLMDSGVSAVTQPTFKNTFDDSKYFFYQEDVCNKEALSNIINNHKPDTVFVFSHIPSAPYSMKDYSAASLTTINNIMGTLSIIYNVKEHCPDAHIIALGSMGEYPHHCGVPIPEGDFQFEYGGYKSEPLPFPKTGGSLYHITKVAMSKMYDFYAKTYDLKISDIYQGVIYGVETDYLYSHLFIDEAFGTCINRFVSQAIAGIPLTIYGSGENRRTYLSLRDAIKCYKLIMNNPPKAGSYEIYNQFDEEYSVNEIAKRVTKIAKEFDIEVDTKNWEHPRIEPSQKNYMPINEKLKNLGYKRTNDLEDELRNMFKLLIPLKEKILNNKDSLEPKTQWRKVQNG